MLPVTQFDEPNDFDALVRKPGTKFLNHNNHPNTVEWSNNSYWTRILPHMRIIYSHICNYSATWIPAATGQDSIDHFLDKSTYTHLAYEWNNFRYASLKMNRIKRKKYVIDPFIVGQNWFILNFKSFHIESNEDILSPANLELVEQTIKHLNFNTDDSLVQERFEFYIDYINGDITIDYMLRNAPFIAGEIIRQNLLIQ